jgi:hypothetical protein
VVVIFLTAPLVAPAGILDVARAVAGIKMENAGVKGERSGYLPVLAPDMQAAGFREK